MRAALEAVRNEPPPRRKVYVRDGDPLVLDEIAQAIAAGGKVFERLGRPVRVRGVENGEAEAAGLHRPTGAPVIEELTVPTLAESAICACHFVRLDRRSDGERDANAPSQYLQMLAANAEGRFPPLYGVIEAPTLSADGSLLARGGYDRASGLFLALEGTWPDIPATPTGSQVEGAVALLNEALFNFPFVDETHKSAAFALLFTLLARDLIPGPVPVFLIDATAPGTGKSLLGDLCSVIASGRPASRWAFVADEDEQRKRLISMALAGDRFVLLDNVEQPVGGSALAGAVTSASISDRRLGTNQTVTAQFRAVLAFTGNGLQLKGDLARRAVAIYLDAHEERPEERRNFRHPRLLDWATQHRPELAVAALTVLRGFLAAGRPSQNLPPFGSFEAWSETIRQALVWAGLPDPCQTRQRIRDDADPDGQAFGDLLRALHAHCGTRPVRVADLLKEVSACDSAEADGSLKEALGYYAERGQDLPSARRLAYVLRSKKGRIVSGLRLDSLMDRKRTTLWRVAPIGEERYAGDAGDAGDTSSPRARSVEDDYGTASETTPPGAGIIAGNDRHHRHLKAVLDTDSDREEVIGQAVLL
ncbi:MAG: hypothetical protein M5U13_13570 [Thermoanaerobaculia bacterium]|nr:hypothetical protein [Thermoanaerobaculia bacterium]